MADRYLRATGNWNGSVWASTPSGAAGSAATPTASDDVYLFSNYDVTLTANAVAGYIYHRDGELNLGSYELQATALFTEYTGSNIRTLNLGSGKLVLNGPYGALYTDDSTVVLSNGSTVIINTGNGSDGALCAESGQTFDDVIINLGTTGASSEWFEITGSPTFRSLIIQSKNSAAHTVRFDGDSINYGGMTIDKFVAIGSGSANKLSLINGSSPGIDYIGVVNSFYAQYITGDVYFSNSGTNTVGIRYAGTGSDQMSGQLTLQDPPKISTLVDPLTTAPASNTNWTVSGTVTQVATGHDGGGYELASGAGMVSTDTYDLTDSWMVFENKPSGKGTYKTYYPQLGINGVTPGYYGANTAYSTGDTTVGFIDDASDITFFGVTTNHPSLLDHDSLNVGFYSSTSNGTTPIWAELGAYVNDYYISALKINSDGTVEYKQLGTDGVWYNASANNLTLTSDELLFYKSARLQFGFGATTIGSINPNLTPPAPQNLGAFLPFFMP